VAQYSTSDKVYLFSIRLLICVLVLTWGYFNSFHQDSVWPGKNTLCSYKPADQLFTWPRLISDSTAQHPHNGR